MRRLIIFLSILLLTLSRFAWAESQTSGMLLRIGTGVAGEGLYLTIDQPTTPVCSSGMLFMPTSAPQYKETYATAVVAFSLGKPIVVSYSPNCIQNGTLIGIDAISIGP